MILLSHLLAEFAGALRERYGHRLLPGHERALTAMGDCRTERSPVLVVRCPDCGQYRSLAHSCGHRSCPHCQHHARPAAGLCKSSRLESGRWRNRSCNRYEVAAPKTGR